jgi:hypothetical protein
MTEDVPSLDGNNHNCDPIRGGSQIIGSILDHVGSLCDFRGYLREGSMRRFLFFLGKGGTTSSSSYFLEELEEGLEESFFLFSEGMEGG